MEFYAFVNFTHNNISIEGGKQFNAKSVGFSKVDIDFLMSQGKIIPLSDIRKNITVEKVIETPSINYTEENIVVDENVKISKIEQPINIKDELASVEVNEVLEDNETVENKETAENVEAAETTQAIENVSDDDITIVIKESELSKLKKEELVKIAASLNIDKPEKLSKSALIKLISETNG